MALRSLDSRSRANLSARFWNKVSRSPDGCWEWTGYVEPGGYGRVALPFVQGRVERAHRVSWILANGQIDEGLYVLHHCDNRKCVRPSHLFLGTYADNNRDMRVKGRAAPVCGLKNPRARLTDAQVRGIRKERDERGESYSVLGARYGITATHCCAIVKRAAWRHV
jgi:hypothetical protein